MCKIFYEYLLYIIFFSYNSIISLLTINMKLCDKIYTKQYQFLLRKTNIQFDFKINIVFCCLGEYCEI